MLNIDKYNKNLPITCGLAQWLLVSAESSRRLKTSRWTAWSLIEPPPLRQAAGSLHASGDDNAHLTHLMNRKHYNKLHNNCVRK